ncbi:MAG: 3-deoxy-D-manno-octulosonic acid transferase [Flavobacteriales bacterium]
MRFTYNTLIAIYQIGIWVYSFFDNKANDIIKGQRDLIKKIKKETKNQNNIVHFHASSLGEFEQGKSVIKEYKKKYPNHKILLTFYSPSGYNIIKNSPIADWVFYLPHDTKKNAIFFSEVIKPIKVIFIKYEFWFNYIIEYNKQNIPIYFISTTFRKNQYFFKWYGKWFAKQLRKVNQFYVQSTTTIELLKSIKITQVTVCGDSRFDTVIEKSNQDYKNEIIEKFCNKKKVLVAGSTWEKDEEILNNICELLNYKLIIAPHEMNSISELKKLPNSILLSESSSSNISTKNILIIDQIGILSKIYKYANITYVGGGFGKGIHNTLEAAVYNKGVIIGPNYHKFEEAKEMISLGIIKSISTNKELITSIQYFEKQNIEEKTTPYFKSKSGAAIKICNSI